mmetsp:Transcript_42013/g.108143  ORF Transcript_42013/g.108143 Transcript_42013/m.108143 type:complete len:96 (-) Transcript_42013:472-759(-)
MIWEVDDDCDGKLSWEDVESLFVRCRQDKTGFEPKRLFNLLEFMLHDKDSSGKVDMDECMEILFHRFGKEALEQVRLDISREGCAFRHDTPLVNR